MLISGLFHYSLRATSVMPFAHIRSHLVFQFVNSHRVLFYGLVSLLSLWAVITNALKNSSNFYAVAIFLSKSSRSVLVGLNLCSLIATLYRFANRCWPISVSFWLCSVATFSRRYSLVLCGPTKSRYVLSFPSSLSSADSCAKRLYDRLWFFITESLLAFTIFRDEVDTPFDLMFGFLLFVKSFHWLASDRIEWVG